MATNASAPSHPYWTIDQALLWIHAGKEADAPLFSGPHRSAECIARLLEALMQGRILASTLEPTRRRRDLRPDEWMDLEFWEDDDPGMFLDDDFIMAVGDDCPAAPIHVRTRAVVHRSERVGYCVPSADAASSEPGAAQWFHIVRDHVLFPAEQVRACFPPPARTATERSRAVAVAEAELRRIIGASAGLRLLPDPVLAQHVKQRAFEAGGQLSDGEYRETRKAIIKEFGAGDWEKAGRQADAKRADVRRILTDLGLAHLAPDEEITAQ